jgi:hypothetical protein
MSTLTVSWLDVRDGRFQGNPKFDSQNNEPNGIPTLPYNLSVNVRWSAPDMVAGVQKSPANTG